MFKKIWIKKKKKDAVSDENDTATTIDYTISALRPDTGITTYSTMNMDDKYKVANEDRDTHGVEDETTQEREKGSVSFLSKFKFTTSGEELFKSSGSNSINHSSSKEKSSNPISIKESSSAQNTTTSGQSEETKTTSNKRASDTPSEQVGLPVNSLESQESTKTSQVEDSTKSSNSTTSTKSQVEKTQKINQDSEASHCNNENNANYDVSPTLLYKLIESKNWGEAAKRIDDVPDECKTWVYRIEDFNSFDLSDFNKKGFTELNMRWRMLPIHSAIIFNAPIKVITALFKAYPESLLECDDRKMLPIHLACRRVSNVNVAQFLVSKSLESLFAQDYKGRRPIDVLRQYRDKSKDGKENDTIDPKEIRNRESLIQLMDEKMNVQQDEPDDNKEDEGDRGVMQVKKKNWVFNILKKKATENALLNNSDENEVKNLASSNCEKKPDEEGHKPEAKDIKMQRSKDMVKEPRKDENNDIFPTLLIKLIEKKMWDQAIVRCTEKPQEASTWMSRCQEVHNDDSTKSKNNDVRWRILPIHSAVVLHAPVELIEALVEAYPKGLQKGDNRKMLALHMAFRLGASPETAAVLVDAYPEALTKKDIRGHTPLHILKAYRRKYEKDLETGKTSNTKADLNRKKLIKFYIGGRKYGQSIGKDAIREFDSDSDSSSDNSSNEDSCYYYDDDNETDFIHEFAQLAIRELTALQYIVRDTVTCRGSEYDLGA